MNLKKYAIVDTHLHLDGSLSPEIILSVAKHDGVKLPYKNIKEIRNYCVCPSDCKSLNEYLLRFDLPNMVLQSKYGIFECTFDLLKRLHNDGLKYVEIRMAPQLSITQGLTQNEVVETLIEARNVAKERLGIKSNFILCMMRGLNLDENNTQTVLTASKYLGKGVVAIDLAGAEGLFPNQLFESQFKLANKLGVPMTIHSGEASGFQSVKSAIEFGAKRIGHGVHSLGHLDLMNELKDKNICLEICPQSNLDTKTIKSIDELGLRDFFNFGIKFSINTDDMTVSNISLIFEFEKLVKLGFSEDEIKRIVLNTIDSCFISDKEKEELKLLI